MMFPIVTVEQSKVFNTSDLKRYITIPEDWLPQVTVTISGKYRPAGFEGTFEGYNKGYLTIKKITIEGKAYYRNKRLRDFLERDFLDLISGKNDDTK